MAKVSTSYICQQCGYRSPQFLGRCPQCQAWGSLVESIESPLELGISSSKNKRSAAPIVHLKDIEKGTYKRTSTLLVEFDRVLGGGIVQGSVVLVAGDPGIGKSTMLSQLALNVSNTLYIAGEESPQQIKIRVERIRKDATLATVNDTDVDRIVATIEKEKPALVIVDSIQTLETTDLVSAPGSVSQVRESAHRLQQTAKKLHIPIFIVGHVTKEGTVAGPKTLEHLVDVVLTLEGDPTGNYRVLRANKNRFGPTDEVGIFEMEESGMREVINPSQVFLESKVNAPGSAVTAILTGLRPMLLEIQALVTRNYGPIPKRVGTGVDNNRLQILVAVLSKRLKLPLYDYDVFVNVTGGVKVMEPASDLAIAMAIVSSLKDESLDPHAVFIGEVGLLGELRPVRQVDKRTAEAKKLGLTNVISPQTVKNLEEVLVKTLHPLHKQAK